ncbi:lysozyme [Xanthobacter sp. YC-JY1]|uniref:lysozyme n=1 Tax=Xanthobacter sp. YC-JY1 TaxID=2419844 RepID=UPI001F350D51|nr:lysozyme [Xanthobacter sp. YC-JY1]UJX45761.1 hypothetical protein D7006_14300 [Xanthobacter sp. YC-JY1]
MASNMKLSVAGLKFIKSFESFVPYVYDDKVPAVKGRYREYTGGPVKGTLTIGYGHTNAAKHPLKVVPGTYVTEAQAREILDVDLDECEEAVNRIVKVPMTQGQFDALVSFTFNCGEANLKKLVAPMNRGNSAATYAKFDEFIRSKGEVMRGLVRRRDGEQGLWASTPKALPEPHEVENVPEEVDAPKKPVSKRDIAAGATAGTAVVVAVKEGVDAVNTVAEPVKQAVDTVSGIASYGSVALIAVAVAAIVAGGVYLWLRNR